MPSLATWHLIRIGPSLFSIVCRLLKYFIDRYFHTKPYRIVDQLDIREGKYALYHNLTYWHPSRDNYSVQQFHAQIASFKNYRVDDDDFDDSYYSFAEMRPYSE